MPAMTEIKKATCPECGKEFGIRPQQIKNQKLILAEGMDVHGFLFHAIRAFEREDDIQVFNFGGINELRLFIKNLANMENFSKVKTLVIACDAETKVQPTIQSIKDALKTDENVDLPIPAAPFQFSSNEFIKTAFILFPGPDKNGKCRVGTIEDLCLETVSGDPLLNCVDVFLECARQNQENNDEIKHPWKSKLHAYLAGKNDHVGKKLGVVARDKVWDFNHDAMAPFKKIIQQM